jgi:hypothetical protein
LSPELQPIVGSGCVTRTLTGNRMAIKLSHLTAADTGRLQEFLLPLASKEAAGVVAANA